MQVQVDGWTVVADDHMWRVKLHRMEGNFSGMWTPIVSAIAGPKDGTVIYEGRRYASLASALEAGVSRVMIEIERSQAELVLA